MSLVAVWVKCIFPLPCDMRRELRLDWCRCNGENVDLLIYVVKTFTKIPNASTLPCSQQAQNINPMIIYCGASVVDAGPALNQHWVNVLSCVLGSHAKSSERHHMTTSGWSTYAHHIDLLRWNLSTRNEAFPKSKDVEEKTGLPSHYFHSQPAKHAWGAIISSQEVLED